MSITVDQARKILETVDEGLTNGMGVPVPGHMCVEAAVCFALGKPHGDDPGCVSPALRIFKIGLNDSPWSSNAARANGLRRLAIAQLGSKDVLDDAAFTARLARRTVQVIVPAALRHVAAHIPTHAIALGSAARGCESAARAADATLQQAADLCIEVLREFGVPGIMLMDQLIPLEKL